MSLSKRSDHEAGVPDFTLEERRMVHAEELFAILRDPALSEFLDEAPPVSVEAMREKLARSESRRSPDGKEHWLNWVVRLPTGRMVGYVQATVEEGGATNVAYVFARDHGTGGIATRAVAQMMQSVAAEHRVTYFLIRAVEANLRSTALAVRLGFLAAPAALVQARGVDGGDVLYWKSLV